MDHILLQSLQTAQSPTEVAAIIADSVLFKLPPTVALAARQCVILHWFNRNVLKALLAESSLLESEVDEVFERLTTLPFIETTPWGVTFQGVTREGLIERYSRSHPELLQQAARLAAPAYRMDSAISAPEAFFCNVIANNHQASLTLLDALLEQANSHENVQTIEVLLCFLDEAERLPFVRSLPRTETMMLFRGLVHRMQGKLDAAIADYTAAIRINPQSSFAYLSRGTVHALQKRYQKALADFERTLQFDPTNLEAYMNQGTVFIELNRYDQALAAFTEALQLEPESREAAQAKSSVLERLTAHQGVRQGRREIQGERTGEQKKVSSLPRQGLVTAEQASVVQRRMLKFIADYIKSEGMPPTKREIGQAMGIASTGHIDYHLTMLEKKGELTRTSQKSRGIKLVKPMTGLPVQGSIAAGEPLIIESEPVEMIDVGRAIEPDNSFALIVKGRSMIEDHILDGDYVVIKPQHTCNTGDIVVAVHNQQGTSSATLKRYFKEHDHIRLQPANSELNPIYVPSPEWDSEWLVQGIVIAIFRMYHAQ